MTTAPIASPPQADHWADARLAARDELGEDVLGPARRGHLLRRTGAFLAQLAVVLAVLVGSYALFDPRTDDLSAGWRGSPAGFAILCLGFVVQLVGSARQSRSAGDLPSTPADAVLPADDRRWVRSQIATGAPVAEERREVVVDRARRLAASAAQALKMLGFVLIMLGLLTTAPTRGLICAAALLTAWAAAGAARDLVVSRRAHRWLRLHESEPS